MSATRISLALALVAVGAVLSYAQGVHGTGSSLQLSGTITMLVGTACLTAVLVRTVAGLRRRGKPATGARPAAIRGSHISPATRERTTAQAEPEGTT